MNRRSFCAILATALIHETLLAAGSQPNLTEDEVDTLYDNGIYRARLSFVIPVPPRLAWEVLTDFDRMADFVPNVESSRIVARDGLTAHVAQKGKLDYGPFTFRFESERRIEMHAADGVILAKAIAGTTKHMQSEMRVTASGQGTELNYRVEMIPDRWIPTSVGVTFMRHELAEQFSAIAREMVRRLESRRTR